MDKAVSVEPGTHTWDSGATSGYLQADNTKVIGFTGPAVRVGYDFSNNARPLHAINTLIQACSQAPDLGPKQTDTTNDWDGAASETVPTAITLTAADVGPLSQTQAGSSADIGVTPAADDFGYAIVSTTTADRVFTITNNGVSLVSGTVSTSAPFSVVAGGTFTDLGVGASTTATVRYTPTTAAKHTGTVTFAPAGGDNAVADVSGIGAELQGSLSFNSDTGTLVAPMVDGGTYISQSVATPSGAGSGISAYAFSITTSGNYKISTSVDAPSTGSNSFFVQVNSEPSFVTDAWDIIDFPTTGFEARDVSIRGSGTFDAPQYDPMIWSLGAGNHILIIRGREANTLLASIAITLEAAAPTSATATGRGGAAQLLITP